MFLFAAKGPCDKSSNGESTRNVYASFPNPQGPEYDDIQLLIETYTIVFYPDDSCRNTNETDCSYTQGALSFEENGTSYTYQLINGEYKVIETTKLPSVKGYTRKTC